MTNVSRSTIQKGVAALFVVIVVGAAAFLMAYSTTLLGLGELDAGYIDATGGEVFAFTDGCVEEALRNFRLNQNYLGGTLSLDNGSCGILVEASGEARTLTVTGTQGNFSRILEAVVALSGDETSGTIITINSWRELGI